MQHIYSFAALGNELVGRKGFGKIFGSGSEVEDAEPMVESHISKPEESHLLAEGSTPGRFWFMKT